MKKEDIHLSDITRILIGEAPPVFLFEVFIRTFLVYICLLYVIRLLGKRMSGQLTIMELSVMLTLGAIVSASMQLPDHGVLEGVLLLLCALWFQRGTSYLGVISSKIEQLTQGKAGIIVKDGVILVDQLSQLKVSRQQVFAQLRSMGVYNLGTVDRMYLEASGMYSVFQSDEKRAGLSVLPPDDPTIQHSYEDASNQMVCKSCGTLQIKDQTTNCAACGHGGWTKAVK